MDYDRDILVDGQLVHVPKRAIVLVFTPDRWSKADAQVVSLIAIQDTVAEGDVVAVASHSVISADAAFDHAIVRNVEVTDPRRRPAVDPDRPDRPRRPADNATVVIEGTATTRLGDAFDVRLSVAPTSDVVVELRPSDSRITLSATRVTLNAGNWPTGVRVTVTAVDDLVRQDPHYTTIDFVVVSGPTAAPARLDVLAYDDETSGVVTVETGSGTLVVAGDTTPDSYFLRLTRRPDGTVKVALITDGQTDVIAGGRIAYEAIGGERAVQLFIGDLAVTGSTITRINDAALGDFRDEGFAVGQRVRLAGAATS